MGPFRFLMCGEYGDKFQRPHYHAIIFGQDFSCDRKFYKTTEYGRLFSSPRLEKLWGHGYTTIGQLSWRSAAYVARYSLKKVNGKRATQKYQRVDPKTGETWQVKPEFITMSRRPGLAHEWWQKYKKDIEGDFVALGGKTWRPPRYYDSLLEQEDPVRLEALKRKRKDAVARRSKDLTEERLKAKEVINEARYKLYQRDFTS